MSDWTDAEFRVLLGFDKKLHSAAKQNSIEFPNMVSASNLKPVNPVIDSFQAMSLNAVSGTEAHGLAPERCRHTC